MKCFCCPTRSPLFRVNAKGQKGVWACERHIQNTDARVDPVVRQIVGALKL